MILTINAQHLVLIAPAVEAAIAAYVTDAQISLEAGGIFIGSHRGPHMEIATCTTPLPRDVRKSTLFDRKDHGHQAAALAAWRSSGGTDTYLGEWHTHPVDDPTPSTLDLRTWRTIMRGVADPVVFLIAGRRSIWCARGHDGKLSEAAAHDAI